MAAENLEGVVVNHLQETLPHLIPDDALGTIYEELILSLQHLKKKKLVHSQITKFLHKMVEELKHHIPKSVKASSWIEIAEAVWTRTRWPEILYQIGTYKKSPFPEEIALLNDLFFTYITELPTMEPVPSPTEQRIVEKILFDFLEHMTTHPTDPCNMLICGSPSHTIWEGFFPLADLAAKSVSFSALEFDRFVVRWDVLGKRNSERVFEEIHHVAQGLNAMFLLRRGDLVVVQASSLPSPQREWFTNQKWEKANGEVYFLARLSAPIIRNALPPSIEVFLDPSEHIKVSVPSSDVLTADKTKFQLLAEHVHKCDPEYFKDIVFPLSQEIEEKIYHCLMKALGERRGDILVDPNVARLSDFSNLTSDINGFLAIHNDKTFFQPLGLSIIVGVINGWIEMVPPALCQQPRLFYYSNRIHALVKNISLSIQHHFLVRLHSASLVWTTLREEVQMLMSRTLLKKISEWCFSSIEQNLFRFLTKKGYTIQSASSEKMIESPEDLQNIQLNLSIVQKLLSGDSADILKLHKLVKGIEKVVGRAFKLLKSEIELVIADWQKCCEDTRMSCSSEDLKQLQFDFCCLQNSINQPPAIPVEKVIRAFLFQCESECVEVLKIWDDLKQPSPLDPREPLTGFTDSNLMILGLLVSSLQQKVTSPGQQVSEPGDLMELLNSQSHILGKEKKKKGKSEVKKIDPEIREQVRVRIATFLKERLANFTPLTNIPPPSSVNRDIPIEEGGKSHVILQHFIKTPYVFSHPSPVPSTPPSPLSPPSPYSPYSPPSPYSASPPASPSYPPSSPSLTPPQVFSFPGIPVHPPDDENILSVLEETTRDKCELVDRLSRLSSVKDSVEVANQKLELKKGGLFASMESVGRSNLGLISAKKPSFSSVSHRSQSMGKVNRKRGLTVGGSQTRDFSTTKKKKKEVLILRKDKEAKISKLYPKLNSTLTSHNHKLAFCLLPIFCSQTSAANPDPTIERMMSWFISLHGTPEALFVEYLKNEADELKDLAVLMRSASVSSCLLKCIFKPYLEQVGEMMGSLLKLSGGISAKAAKLLVEHGSQALQVTSPKHVALKIKLKKELHNLLKAENFPVYLCALCHQCLQVVNSVDDIKKGEKVSVSNWAVGAIFFLRLAVPLITSHTEEVRKTSGLRFLGRLLMKLCCKSEFNETEEGSIANEIIRESLDLFDSFCVEVVERGKNAGENFEWESSGVSEEPMLFPAMASMLVSYGRDLFRGMKDSNLSQVLELYSLLLEFHTEIISKCNETGEEFSLSFLFGPGNPQHVEAFEKERGGEFVIVDLLMNEAEMLRVLKENEENEMLWLQLSHAVISFGYVKEAMTAFTIAQLKSQEQPTIYTLFLKSSPFTSLAFALYKSQVSKYLHCVTETFYGYVQNYMNDLIETLHLIEAEPSPKQQLARGLVREAFQILMKMIIGATKLLPESFLDGTSSVCGVVGSLVDCSGVSDEESQRLFLVSFFFDRFLCPALNQAEGIQAGKFQCKKVGLFLSRMLQMGGLGKGFEKESMKFANGSLTEAEGMMGVLFQILKKETLPLRGIEILEACGTFFEATMNLIGEKRRREETQEVVGKEVGKEKEKEKEKEREREREKEREKREKEREKEREKRERERERERKEREKKKEKDKRKEKKGKAAQSSRWINSAEERVPFGVTMRSERSLTIMPTNVLGIEKSPLQAGNTSSPFWDEQIQKFELSMDHRQTSGPSSPRPLLQHSQQIQQTAQQPPTKQTSEEQSDGDDDKLSASKRSSGFSRSKSGSHLAYDAPSPSSSNHSSSPNFRATDLKKRTKVSPNSQLKDKKTRKMSPSPVSFSFSRKSRRDSAGEVQGQEISPAGSSSSSSSRTPRLLGKKRTFSLSNKHGGRISPS